MPTNLETTLSPAIRGDVVASPAAVILARVTMQAAGGTQITVAPTIYREWVTLSCATTATGSNVQNSLGWPIEDFRTPDGAEIVYFERGAIVLRRDGRCFATYGTIYLHWRDLYDVKTGAGLNLGYPIGEEEAISGGRRSRFDYGDMYWNAARNAAFEVHGGIRDEWYALGGYGGFLGYPLTDESSVRRGGSEIGRFNQFEGGTMYWSGATGAFEVHGAIRDLYLEGYSGPQGSLGFPLSNETGSPGGMRRYNNFQNGCVVWHADSGELDVYTALEVFVSNINGSGSHTFFESIGTSSVWLYANVNVTTTTGINANFRLPGSGDYGDPSAAPGNIFNISPVRGDMTVMLTMDGWDHCISTSDAHLGTLRATFNVDNDFGVNAPRHIDDGDFHGDLDMTRQSIDNPNDPNFRRAEWWGFNNFRTPELSRAQYAETFVDVESSESDFHWFDDLFYNEFFKGIGAGGNCYGMCVESIYAEHSDSLFSEPIYGVAQGTASSEVNLKQAYQLGASYLDWYVSNFVTLNFWDPCKVYYAAKAAWDARDYPFICLTDANRSAGHCVRPATSAAFPYPFVDNGAQLIISVANPNAPGTDGRDAASQIVIDKAANTYSIALSNGGATWTGGHLTGGIISWAPFSVVCSEPRTPFWEALSLALGAALILLGSNGTTVQMTDNNGGVLYKPERVRNSNRWDDFAMDATGIAGLARVPLTAAFLSHGPIVGGVLSDHEISLLSNPGPELYRLVGLGSPWGTAPSQSEFTPINTGIETVRSSASSALAMAAINPANSTGAASRGFAIGVNRNALNGLISRSMLKPPTTIKHQIQAGGAYSWGVQTTVSAAVITVTGGSADEVGLDNIGAIDQTVSLHAPSGGTRTATIAMRVRAPLTLPATVFSLQNVTVSSGNTFSANVLSDGKTLQLQNNGEDCTVGLQVSSGTETSAMKSLKIPAGKVATVTPQDLSALPSTPVQVNIMPSVGGAVEQTLSI